MSIRMRHTRGHTGNRRSHHALKKTNIVATEGGAFRLPHHLDESTGMYRGKLIVEPRAKGVKATKVKGPETEPKAAKVHDHSKDHANADAKATRGIAGKVATGGRPKARSGMGGQAS